MNLRIFLVMTILRIGSEKMNKPTLWIMCGLSGSGKSTIATQIANENPNTIIVSSDAIREELTGNYENQEHNEEVFSESGADKS